MTYNSDSPEQVKQAKTKRKIETDVEVKDLRAIMSIPQGRRFVWRLLDKAGVYRTSFTGNSKTFFLEGQRNIGLLVLGDITKHCLDLYTKMVEENVERET